MYKLKLNYLSLYDFHRYEAWLNDMCKKGLELQKYIGVFALFKKVKLSNLKFVVIHKKDIKQIGILDVNDSIKLINTKSDWYILASESKKIEVPQIDIGYVDSKLSRTNRAYISLLVFILLTMLFCVYLTSWHPVFYFAPLLLMLLDQIWYNSHIKANILHRPKSSKVTNWRPIYYKYKIILFLIITYYIVYIFYIL